MTSIVIKDLSLRYPIYANISKSLRQGIVNLSTGGRVFRNEKVPYVSALNNINLEIKEGDKVGIIGHNGAGKTTILKTIAGIYKPTSGTIEVHGRLTSIFNTCVGLDLEKNGYDNIIFMGMLLGLKLSEIKALTPQIGEFSGLGEYLHLPVKSYSDGMRVRLGFALCTSIEAEILLLDEGIGAGDKDFIEKATKRVEEFYAKAKILVISSHSPDLLKKFCNKFLWLEKGSVKAYGGFEVLKEYSNEGISTAKRRKAKAIA